MLTRAVFTMISSDFQSRISDVWSCPRTGFCAVLHPFLGGFSCLNTFSLFLNLFFSFIFHFPVLLDLGNTLCWEAEASWGGDYVFDCFIKWDLPFGDRRSWQGAEEAPGMLPSPWFHRVPPSVSCCTVELVCSSYNHHLHWASLQEGRGFDWTLNTTNPKAF